MKNDDNDFYKDFEKYKTLGEKHSAEIRARLSSGFAPFRVSVDPAYAKLKSIVLNKDYEYEVTLSYTTIYRCIMSHSIKYELFKEIVDGLEAKGDT